MNSDFLLGGLLTLAVAVVCSFAHDYGRTAGINEVVNSCSNYSKYKIEGTRQMLCSAIYNPEDLMHQKGDPTFPLLYSKENKDKHKKDRK